MPCSDTTGVPNETNHVHDHVVAQFSSHCIAVALSRFTVDTMHPNSPDNKAGLVDR